MAGLHYTKCLEKRSEAIIGAYFVHPVSVAECERSNTMCNGYNKVVYKSV